MPANPFRPPDSAPAPAQAPAPLLVPVFVGTSVGTGSYYLTANVVGFAFMWWLTATGTPLARLYREVYANVPFVLASHVLASACMALGGYWAARIDATGRRRPALLCAVATIVLVLLQDALPYDLPIPGWSRIASLVLPIPLYLAGAALWRRRAQAAAT